jgi:diadenosine tetraphosphate (Ap4A) HIT family hydrolase
MNTLYAPWRTQYFESQDKIEGCVFCHIANNPQDHKSLGVLYAQDDFFIVMNKYPYTPGHFMIIPNFHTANLEDLDSKIFAKISNCAQQGVKMLKEVLNAQGVNMGMNLGVAAGAGIAEHIHLHLVPRWSGDTNFITTVSEHRVYGNDFDKIYNTLREASADYFR